MISKRKLKRLRRVLLKIKYHPASLTLDMAEERIIKIFEVTPDVKER